MVYFLTLSSDNDFESSALRVNLVAREEGKFFPKEGMK